MTLHSLTRRFALPAASLLLAAFLVACGGAERDERGEIVDDGDLDVFQLRIGDCFQDASAEEISDVKAVPCSQPHDNEVYYLFKVAEGPYPGDEALENEAIEGCFDEFETYVGIDYESSRFDYTWLTPTESSWNSHRDREIVCVLFDLEFEKLTGSLKGRAE